MLLIKIVCGDVSRAECRWFTWLYIFGGPTALHATYVRSDFNSPVNIPQGAHPIDVLLKQGEDTFRRLNGSQSTTLQEGVKEYKRRYGRNPPKGFDKWWEFAAIRGITLMDGESCVIVVAVLIAEYDSELTGFA
jgi:hypothetical protein